jgi:hypothetical protein
MRCLLVLVAACTAGNTTIGVGVTIGSPDVAVTHIVVHDEPSGASVALDPATQRGELTVPIGDDHVFHADGVDASGAIVASSSSHRAVVDDGAVVALQLTPVTAAAMAKNRPPVIDAVVASKQTMEPSETITLSVTAHDPDGDPITIAWSGSGTFGARTSATTSWQAPAKNGSYTVSVTVTDSHNGRATTSLALGVVTTRGTAKVTVTIQSAPQISQVTIDSGRLRPGLATKLRAVAFDADRDTLTYAWRDDCGAAITGTGKTVTLKAPAATPAKSCTLHVDVADGHGFTDGGELVVAVGAPVVADDAPSVDSTFQSVDRTSASGSVVFRATAHDPEGSAIAFAWSADRGVLSTQIDTTTATSVSWTAPSPFTAGATVTLTVRDAKGASSITTFEVANTN